MPTATAHAAAPARPQTPTSPMPGAYPDHLLPVPEVAHDPFYGRGGSTRSRRERRASSNAAPADGEQSRRPSGPPSSPTPRLPLPPATPGQWTTLSTQWGNIIPLTPRSASSRDFREHLTEKRKEQHPPPLSPRSGKGKTSSLRSRFSTSSHGSHLSHTSSNGGHHLGAAISGLPNSPSSDKSPRMSEFGTLSPPSVPLSSISSRSSSRSVLSWGRKGK